MPAIFTCLLLFFGVFAPLGCADGTDRPAGQEGERPDSSGLAATGPVRTGAMVLVEDGLPLLKGKRLGLVVNHTAMVDSVHLIDLLVKSKDYEVVALFGPEHGIRGEAPAGEKVSGGNDPISGIPIYSLYGDTRRPTPEMLKGVDALVFDIQDVGARFYTYITTMGLSMQSAAEAGIPFVVLDRPNPLSGAYVSGFVIKPSLYSFVGQYPVPIAHGLTVGELARMIKGEAMLSGLENLDLQVVEMQGWQRGMTWKDTGLPWVAPSPNIPTVETALIYPGSGLFEAVSANEGRGTHAPFLQVGAPWVDGEAMADELNSRKIPGVRFAAVDYRPVDIRNMATDPRYEGEVVHGVKATITDQVAFEPVETGIHLLHAFYHAAPEGEQKGFISRPEWLAKLSGSSQLQHMIESGETPEAIIASWKSDVDAFRTARAPYLLYE